MPSAHNTKMSAAANKTSDEIVWLKTDAAIDSRRFGAKAARLALLSAKGFPVPNGFCLDAPLLESLDPTREEFPSVSKSLLEAFQRLIRASASGSVIVRSSASVEDNPRHLFPGLFVSRRKVRTFDQLKVAIADCIASATSPSVLEYAKALCVDRQKIAMAVLVQEEIDSPVSGVAFTRAPRSQFSKQDGVYVECSLGQTDPWKLDHPVYAYFVAARSAGENIERASVADLVHPRGDRARSQLLRSVSHLAQEVKARLGEDQDIEWIADQHDQPLLVQARPIHKRSPLSPVLGHKLSKTIASSKRNRSNVLFQDEKLIGLKGEAMKYFVKEGLFTLATVFVQPQESLQEIKEKIINTNFGNRGITIRFSYGNEVGLPREFVKTNREALEWFLANWKKKWLGILYGYMDVRHSFELYLDSKWWVLEHVPGVWESNNKIEPDVIMSSASEDLYLRATTMVTAYYVDPEGVHREEAHPVEAQQLFGWQSRLLPIIDRLMKRFRDSLPINIHFVEDESGNWQFLNIRMIGKLSHNMEYGERRGYFHVVSTKEDLDIWDHRKPILLQVTTNRGTERDLLRILGRLPKNLDQIFISFGLLSHPAIVLREYGLTPVPLYSSHEVFRRTKGERHV